LRLIHDNVPKALGSITSIIGEHAALLIERIPFKTVFPFTNVVQWRRRIRRKHPALYKPHWKVRLLLLDMWTAEQDAIMKS
jgi:hypothetical protein